MYYTVYKTTNLVNSKIYIGVHKTDNPNDTYLGSNRILKAALEKYGQEKFKKEILFNCSSEEEMYRKESELVTEDFCSRKDTYNIAPGGKGNSNFGKIVTERKIGIHAMTFEERSQRSKNTQANLDPAHFKEIRSKAGKAGIKSQIENKVGIFGYSFEQRSEHSKKLSKIQKENESGFFKPGFASEVGKIGGKKGGPKNKGFIWYNDGINTFKYTSKQQVEKSFEEFLCENPTFKSGRSLKKTGPRLEIRGTKKFVTNGLLNRQVHIDILDEFLRNNQDFRLGKTHYK